MDVEEEDGTNEVKKGKTKTPRTVRDSVVSSKKRNVKGILLSVTKPSYTLKRGIGRDIRSLRWEHRKILRDLLRQLVRRHNWDEAAGVLSVLLMGTYRENSISKNRAKYWATMELLKHINDDGVSPRKILHVYEIWMKKIVSTSIRSVKDRVVVQLEFVLFCLAHGDTEDAYQAVIGLMQEREFRSDPISNLVVGLAFCQLWYTAIQKELQLNNLDESYTPMQSETLGSRFNMLIDNSNGHDAIEFQEANSHFQRDSNTSIRIDKEIGLEQVVDQSVVPMEVDDNIQRETPHHSFQPQGFCVNSTESDGSMKSSFSNDTGITPGASIFYAHALEPWLLPLRVSQSNELEDFVNVQRRIHNDRYKGAVKHLQNALHSSPPSSEALLPLIQMLLLGDQVKEALDEVEKFVHISDAALPSRLKASLLEHFDSNYVKLSTCFEETLKRDPTCSHSLARLIHMHQNGYYSAEKLLEMIALHLDATYAEFNTWKEFASCFLKLSQCEEDRMSTCLDGNVGGYKQNYSNQFNRIPEMLMNDVLGKDWRLRCRWWLTRHFSQNRLASEVAAGNLELLTYKAASASHLYGREFQYVVKVSACLEKEENREMFSILQMHKQNSVGFYLNFGKKIH